MISPKIHSKGHILPELWRSIRESVLTNGCVLGQVQYESIRNLYMDYYSTGKFSPGQITREYDHEEFLLVLDEEGRALLPAPAIVKNFQETTAQNPDFSRWFREERSPAGEQVLLVSRWLCHLVGFRHGTVEIFIDPPHLKEYTLVQVRSLEKFEAPGAFDIPCAGHINGVDTFEVSLRKELAEELNILLDDLMDVRLIKRYNSKSRVKTEAEVKTEGVVNNEYRVLYQARLKSGTARQIRFTDGEVAGLAIFSIAQLRLFLQRYPERVASGLSDAIRFYE